MKRPIMVEFQCSDTISIRLGLISVSPRPTRKHKADELKWQLQCQLWLGSVQPGTPDPSDEHQEPEGVD